MPDRIRWLGHSTVLIELDGVLALTDPLLRKRGAAPSAVRAARRRGGRRGGRRPALAPTTTTSICVAPAARSHHPNRRAPGMGSLVSRQGFRSVVGLSAGEETAVGDVTVRAVPAEHASSRIVGKKAQALGYVVAGSRYFAGDATSSRAWPSSPTASTSRSSRSGAGGPSIGPGHLDPRRAAEALAILRPRAAVPIHWGTYYPLTSKRRTPPAFLSAPAGEFERAAAQRAVRPRCTCSPWEARSLSRIPVPEEQVGDAAGRDRGQNVTSR